MAQEWQVLLESDKFKRKLEKLLQRPVLYSEPMSKHTTWRIGGPADIFLRPGHKDEVVELLRLIQENGIPFMILGNGSNLLVSDAGIRGMVIRFGGSYSRRIWRDEEVEAQAGAMLPSIAMEAGERALSGFEFAGGIPGSIGGAIRMNAGAYGNYIGEYVTKVEAFEYNGTIKTITAQELSFAYRESSLADQKLIVSSVSLRFKKGDREESLKKIQELLKKRSLRQPLEYPSCGSVFKNPLNDHAGRLIEKAGLRGMQIGGAAISKKHGNFIINLGGARAEDVERLIAEVIRRVEEDSGLKLETEVKMVGQF